MKTVKAFSRFIYAVIFISACFCSCSQNVSETPGGEEEEVADDKFEDQTAVETYKYVNDISSSAKYQVYVNGVRQVVFPTSEGQICSFGCEGTVQVKILTNSDINTADIRPVSKKYKSEIVDNRTVTVEVKPYDRVVMELNGSEVQPLFIFANPKSEKAGLPSKDAEGVIYYAAGEKVNIGSLCLKTGQTLVIEGGAVLEGDVFAQNAQNVKITGFGIVDCRKHSESQNGIRIQGCSNVSVEGISVLNDNGRVIFAVNSDNVTLDNIKAIGQVEGEQTDAIDLYCDHDVKVKRSFAYGNDDTYCIKSQKFGYKGECWNIEFEDCIARNFRGNSFEIGYETNMNIHDVTYKDIYSIHSSGGSTDELRRGAVSIHCAAAGTVSNVLYKNVYIEDPKEHAIDIRILKSSYNIGDGIEWAPGHIKDVTLRNVKILKKAPYESIISGYDSEHRIENLTFENLSISGFAAKDAESGKFKITQADVLFK